MDETAKFDRLCIGIGDHIASKNENNFCLMLMPHVGDGFHHESH